jgi:hypothetical protein
MIPAMSIHQNRRSVYTEVNLGNYGMAFIQIVINLKAHGKTGIGWGNGNGIFFGGVDGNGGSMS